MQKQIHKQVFTHAMHAMHGTKRHTASIVKTGPNKLDIKPVSEGENGKAKLPAVAFRPSKPQCNLISSLKTPHFVQHTYRYSKHFVNITYCIYIYISYSILYIYTCSIMQPCSIYLCTHRHKHASGSSRRTQSRAWHACIVDVRGRANRCRT